MKWERVGPAFTNKITLYPALAENIADVCTSLSTPRTQRLSRSRDQYLFVCVVSVHINHLKPKLVFIIFKNPARTSKRTPHFTITKINWLMLFKPLKTKLV
jgi:hypothetical protein